MCSEALAGGLRTYKKVYMVSGVAILQQVPVHWFAVFPEKEWDGERG